MTNDHRTTTRRALIRSVWLVGSGAALGAIAAPSLDSNSLSASARQEASAPTQTRSAELDELHGLQTQVAEPRVCTPAATETAVPPTATATVVPPTASATVVPPVPAGQPVSYADIWLITALGIAPVPAGDMQTQGQLLKVNLTLVNQTNGIAVPPFLDWLLTDATGQSYDVSLSASNEIAGAGWSLSVGPGESSDRAIVFDVPTTIGTTFILESPSEPAFRVALAIESRG